MIGSEGHSRLPTDHAVDITRIVGEETRRDLQDPFQGLPRLPLALVQARALERLASEISHDACQRLDLGIDVTAPVEEEAK